MNYDSRPIFQLNLLDSQGTRTIIGDPELRKLIGPHNVAEVIILNQMLAAAAAIDPAKPPTIAPDLEFYLNKADAWVVQVNYPAFLALQNLLESST